MQASSELAESHAEHSGPVYLSCSFLKNYCRKARFLESRLAEKLRLFVNLAFL
jgi:hypothetical protein